MVESELDKWASKLMGYSEGDSLSLNFHPSEDLNQTFMVVDKMWELGWYLQLHTESKEALFYSHNRQKKQGWSDNSNLAHAILEAAYQAWEAK